MEGNTFSQFLRDLPFILGALSTIFGGIYVFYNKVILPAMRAYQNYKNLLDKVDLIAEEMKPNGGNSIKDAVHRIEKELTLSSERYKALIADYDSAIFETDAKGNCTWVNRTLAKTVQRIPIELMGNGWINTIAKNDRERVVTEWQKSIEEEREFSNEFSFETPEGNLIPVKVFSYKMINREGDTIGFLGICRIVGT